MRKSRAEISYFRNFIFGVEDSLVSTVGLLSGIAIAGMSKESIFLTGVVLIFVEAISMAAGSFLSESSAEEFAHDTKPQEKRSVFAAFVMFISYFISGFIPLAPYLLLTPHTALWVSIAVSIIALSVLGAITARLSKTSLTRSMFRMASIGGLAIVVGTVVGLWLGR